MKTNRLSRRLEEAQDKPSTSTSLQPILDDMQQLSEAVDAANGSSEYQVALVSLGLVARHYLRELRRGER